LSALAGRTIVLHLDDRGRVVSIDEMPALWSRVCDGIADAVAARRNLQPDEPALLSARVIGPMRALPPERQRALLATLVTAAIMTDPIDPVGSSVPASLPGSSPFGTPATLEGTRRTFAVAGGMIRTFTTASAVITLPGQGSALPRSGSVWLERLREFDPRTAMLTAATDAVRNRSGTGAAARETLLVTRLQIERATPAAWPR
jgi:hypothetical protein